MERKIWSFQDLASLPRVARGISGVISEYKSHEVVKWPYPCADDERNHEIERRIYTRLGRHARIVHVIAILPERGIVMERLKEPLCLRLKTLQENGDTVSSEQIQRWSLQIAEALHYIHSKRVLQADIGSQNLLLDEKDNLKFADFAGSSIDGEQAFVCSSSRASLRPYWEHHPSIKDEIFAMGSILYEISTGRKPYHDKTDSAVEKLYLAAQFPDTDHLQLGPVIWKCWKIQYEDTAETLSDLQQLFQRKKCSYIWFVEENLMVKSL
ncbi:hypothetical protein CIHG_06363 [Coccidioides immitis H538.4]|uniref:Protein kinase domain-containing protein n=1 Tax=Coccidioides immitis H538.4 TaxID=396776 RepID=A0A0J8ULY2_COCIT|nr:hypothetical protein CIHG_06363 [Coccidioides immitis H538.4]TPX20281.1 hypothetical protein DIZ76_016169 [Coccidioides immitis]